MTLPTPLHPYTPTPFFKLGIALLAIWLNFTELVFASPHLMMTGCTNLVSTADRSVCNDHIIAQVTNIPTPVSTPSQPQVLSPSFKQQIATKIAKLPLESQFKFFNLFIIFFVTLGPLKIIPVFVQLTENTDQTLRQQLAFRSAAISTITIILVAIIGQNILNVWRIQLPALMIAAGILLFLVALQIVMAQYASPAKVEIPEQPSLKQAVTPLAFPTILPPFGIAIALTMMVIAGLVGINQSIVVLLLLLVMGLNLVCMLAARQIITFIKPVILRILGFVLGVMQLALGIELMVSAIEIEVLVIKQLLEP
ncbi:MarC family protein [Fischerella sp. JS2]|uniref:MarC family protein n=1 Tax=Fischerella sp. JS2 TaxID=2597771 RepID=UPI0028F1126B|nr:MarC family protein [Fischerella sp. JS2]